MLNFREDKNIKMLVLIILTILFIAFVVVHLIERHRDNEFSAIVSFLLAAIIFILLVTFSIMAVLTQCSIDQDYERMLNEKQLLEYRLRHCNFTLPDNSQLYHDIKNFNNEICSNRAKCDSLWVGLFYNEKIATIEYLILE